MPTSPSPSPTPHYVLTITLPNHRIWDAYHYGSAQSVEVADLPDGRTVFRADYGDNSYLANYQNDRFASGLYFGTVTQTLEER